MDEEDPFHKPASGGNVSLSWAPTGQMATETTSSPSVMDTIAQQAVKQAAGTLASGAAERVSGILKNGAGEIRIYIEKNHYSVVALSFVGGLALTGVSLLGCLNVFAPLVGPLTYALKFYQLCFGITICVIDGPTERVAMLTRWQESIASSVPFLHSHVGRSLFYFFVACLEGTQESWIHMLVGWYFLGISVMFAALKCKRLGGGADEQPEVAILEEAAEGSRHGHLLAAGCQHTVGLTTAGRIVACGLDLYDQCKDVPCLYEGEIFTMVAAGSDHTAGLTSSGRILAWGEDSRGQCCRVPGLPDCETFIMVAAGSAHTAGLTSAGRILAWGANKHGQCRAAPQCSRGDAFTMVSAGGDQTAGLTTAGHIVTWGDDSCGQCSIVPSLAAGETFLAVSAGGAHIAGLTTAGRIIAWGKDAFGQCSDVPFLPDGESFTMVASGGNHTAGLTSAGRIHAWGFDSFGQCSKVPSLAHGESFVMVAAGAAHTVGLTSAGHMLAWGYDSFGQCREVARYTDAQVLLQKTATSTRSTPQQPLLKQPTAQLPASQLVRPTLATPPLAKRNLRSKVLDFDAATDASLAPWALPTALQIARPVAMPPLATRRERIKVFDLDLDLDSTVDTSVAHRAPLAAPQLSLSEVATPPLAAWSKTQFFDVGTPGGACPSKPLPPPAHQLAPDELALPRAAHSMPQVFNLDTAGDAISSGRDLLACFEALDAPWCRGTQAN